MPDALINNSFAYTLDGHGKGEACELKQLVAQTGESQTGAPLWIHADISDKQSVQWLTDSSLLNPIVLDALLADETRPRATTIDDGLLIVLRGVNMTPGSEPDDMVSIRIWVEKDRIISTRRRHLRSVVDVARQLETGQGPASSSEFLVSLIDRIVWHMSDTIDQLEDRVADLEDQVVEQDSSSLRYELANLRRQVITLRRYLAPQREALSRLLTEKLNWFEEASKLGLREVADRQIRHIEDLDAVRERAAVTQEELLSRISEQLNTRMYVMSVVAAIFLPLGFLTGLLGINVGGVPGTDNSMAFWVFSGMLIVIVVLQLLYFRFKKWL